jgi:hypothetical protein
MNETFTIEQLKGVSPARLFEGVFVKKYEQFLRMWTEGNCPFDDTVVGRSIAQEAYVIVNAAMEELGLPRRPCDFRFLRMNKTSYDWFEARKKSGDVISFGRDADDTHHTQLTEAILAGLARIREAACFTKRTEQERRDISYNVSETGFRIIMDALGLYHDR